jgi:hypothetical protein
MSADAPAKRPPLHVHFSKWTAALTIAWGLLGLRIGYAILRGEPLGGDLSLPLIAFIFATAVLGSRVWSLFRPAELDERHSDGKEDHTPTRPRGVQARLP